MPKSSRFAVFGMGRYGKQIALSLASKGAEVFTFDNNTARSEGIKDDVALAVTLGFYRHSCAYKRNGSRTWTQPLLPSVKTLKQRY
jgi:UDP-N-acetylmuramoylalanine-D-glutamate ligase